MKILTTRRTSPKAPTCKESSAMPIARAPAENVPKARLNPLLSVAPGKDEITIKTTSIS